MKSTTHTATATRRDLVQFLTFTLREEEYGIPILGVQEIKGYSGFTSIPNAPAWVKGVMNLRGAVVPVFDLRARFALPAAEFTRFHVVVVVNVGTRICGLVVDAVSEVVSIDPSAIEPPPDLGIGEGASFLTGMFKSQERLVAVLDVERVCGLGESAIADGSRGPSAPAADTNT